MDDMAMVERRLERLEEALAHLQHQVGKLDAVLRTNTDEGLDTAQRLERLERAVRTLRPPTSDLPPIPPWVGAGDPDEEEES